MAVFDRNGGPMPDFAPAPTTLETNFGSLRFTGGGYPDAESAERIFDELDLQRATQLYLDLYPAVSVQAILAGQARDLGARTNSDVGVMADRVTARSLYLTANTDSVYATLTIDLSEEGPIVIEIPAGMYGFVDDAAFKCLADLGPSGPDGGNGGKYLLLPPDHDGDVPDGYFVVRSPSYLLWPMVRASAELVGTGDDAVAWYRDNLRVYPLDTGPREGAYINSTPLPINTLVAEDGTAFEWLNEIVQREPADLFSAEQRGRLASIGIRKGEPFQPDERMRRVLDQAAKQGVAMARAINFANRDPGTKYWPGRQWDTILTGQADFMVDGALDPDARMLWHFQAIGIAPAMASVAEGRGSAYVTTCRDADGDYLDGSKNYVLHVAPEAPAKQFWSVTLYDPSTRCLLETEDPYPSMASWRDHTTNDDGSVDVYFGPKRPTNDNVNWVRTNPDKGWFGMFRLYGPLRPYIDKTWVLDDFHKAT